MEWRRLGEEEEGYGKEVKEEGYGKEVKEEGL